MTWRPRRRALIILLVNRAWPPLLALALTGWAAPAAAQQRLPTRAQVEAAVNAWFACPAGTECSDALRRRLTASRCQRLPSDSSNAGRILCTFSGMNVGGNVASTRFRNDCVYMMPAPRGGWRVSAIPDADMCG